MICTLHQDETCGPCNTSGVNEIYIHNFGWKTLKEETKMDTKSLEERIRLKQVVNVLTELYWLRSHIVGYQSSNIIIKSSSVSLQFLREFSSAYFATERFGKHCAAKIMPSGM
jgi:hypothetical protein